MQPGARLRAGRYRLIGRLREGGTATIWRALDTRERAERALKAIPLDMDGARAAELEAEVSARVAHPGVVRVHAAFSEAGHGWVVMERAAGSLADAVEAHGPLDGALLRRVARDLCEALAAAHAAGVVHRDIKPQNVLVHADGRVQLADFGIAQVHAAGHTRTRTGAMLGTLPFMAPEQRRDARAVRPATDVYALAVLLAWARTGAAPGELYVPAALDRLRADLRAAGEPDDALFELLVAAGAYAPEERPADGAALRERILTLTGEVAADASALMERVAEQAVEEARTEAVTTTGTAPPIGASGLGGTANERASGAEAGALRGRPEAPPQEATDSQAAPGSTRERGAAYLALAFGGVALAGVAVGGWLRADRAAGTVGAASGAVEVAAPPACAPTWRPTSFARTLGPRETVGVAADDLDGDGHVDVVFANQLDESLSIYWGDGAARLGAPDTLPVGRVSAGPAVGDLDGDGRAELIVPDADKSELRVYRQEAGRRWVAGPVVAHPDFAPTEPVALLHWDADPLLDLIVFAEGGVRLRRGLGGDRFDAEQLQIGGAQSSYAIMRRGVGADAVMLAESDASRLEAGVANIPRRTMTWPAAGGVALSFGARTFVQRGYTITELLSDGTRCVLGEVAFALRALTDLDRDGVPEGLGYDTCAGCTSNHVVVGGG